MWPSSVKHEVPEDTPASSAITKLHSLSHVLSGGVLNQKMRTVRKKRRLLLKQRHFIRVATDQEGSIRVTPPFPALARSSHPTPLGRLLENGSLLLRPFRGPLLELPTETLGNSLRLSLHSLQVTTNPSKPGPHKAAASAAAAAGGGRLLGRTHSAPNRHIASRKLSITGLSALAGSGAGGLWPSIAAAANADADADAGARGLMGTSDYPLRLVTSSSCGFGGSNYQQHPTPGHVPSKQSPAPPQIAAIGATGLPAADAPLAAPLLPADFQLEGLEDMSWEACADLPWEACTDGVAWPLTPPAAAVAASTPPAAAAVAALTPPAAAVAALPSLGAARAISTGFPIPAPKAATSFPQQQQVPWDADKISAELASWDSKLYKAACGAPLPADVHIPPLDHSALRWGESVREDVLIDDVAKGPDTQAAATAAYDESVVCSLGVGPFGAISSVSAGTAVAAGVPGDCQLRSCTSPGLLPVEVAASAAALQLHHSSQERPGGMVTAAGWVELQPARTFTTHGPNGVNMASEQPAICRRQGATEGNMLAPLHPGSSRGGRVWGSDPLRAVPLEREGSSNFMLPPKYKAKPKPLSRQLELSAEPRSCAFVAAPPLQLLGDGPASGSSSRTDIHGLGSEPILPAIPSRNDSSHQLVCSSGAIIHGSNVTVPVTVTDTVPAYGKVHPAMQAPFSVGISGPSYCGLPTAPDVSQGMSSDPTYELPLPAAATSLLTSSGWDCRSGYDSCSATALARRRSSSSSSFSAATIARSPLPNHSPVHQSGSEADFAALCHVNPGMYVPQQQQYAHQQHDQQQQQQHSALPVSSVAAVENSSIWLPNGGAASVSPTDDSKQHPLLTAALQGQQQHMDGDHYPNSGNRATPEQELRLPVISTSVPLPQAQL